MKYFLHDTNAFQDEKITSLFMEFGYEGLGLFYTMLEKMAAQEKPIKTSVLKAQLQVGKRLEKCWSFMEEIGVISSRNGETFNERILSYSEKYLIKKEKNRDKVAQWREKQADTKNVTGNVTVTKPVRNHRKDNISKVKVYIEEIVGYLNERTGKSFRVDTKQTQALINARLNEDRTVEDFKKVIDLKATQWLLDPKMSKYLNPQTLFGEKFENYLNEAPASKLSIVSKVEKEPKESDYWSQHDYEMAMERYNKTASNE